MTTDEATENLRQILLTVSEFAVLCTEKLHILDNDEITRQIQELTAICNGIPKDKDSIEQSAQEIIALAPRISHIADLFDKYKSALEQQAQTHESATAKRAKKILSPVDKISQSVFHPSKTHAFYEGCVDLVVGRKGKNEVTTAVSMRIENLDEVKFSGATLTPYDRAFMDAINSLFFAGNSLASFTMIHRTMTGKDYLEDKSRLIMSQSVDRLMHTIIEIDATQEAKAFGFEAFKFKGHLLPCQLVTAQINGKTVECLKLLDEPPLLAYAKRKKQLNTYDVRFLNAPFEAISATPENIEIVSNLLNHIMAIRNPNSNIKNIILYEPLYELAGINNAPTEATLRAKHKKFRDKIHKILDVWTNAGLIDGFEDLNNDGNPAKQGEKITKVKVFCTVKKHLTKKHRP